MKITQGDAAPHFSLPDQTGQMRDLKSYLGSWVLLYFYPKDDTPGCTLEACSIRDNWKPFQAAGITVVGVSTDGVTSHKKFTHRYKLPFTLLADEDKTMVKAYGVYGKKKFMGREYMGTNRMSFLINPEGKVAKVYEKVKPTEHALEVLHDQEDLLK